jgi:hypothetical protein
MAIFKIIHTQKVLESEITEFYVEFIEGILSPGNEFITYDTHHPVQWTVLKVLDTNDICLLRCKSKLGIGWDDQFSGAIVDTSAT